VLKYSAVFRLLTYQLFKYIDRLYYHH